MRLHISSLICSMLIVLSLVTGCSTNSDNGGSKEIENVFGTFNQNATYKVRSHNGFIYAGTDSGLNATNTLFFVKSTDFGETWQMVKVPGAPATIRTNDIISVMTGGQEVLYFGTNKGVYGYTIAK